MSQPPDQSRRAQLSAYYRLHHATRRTADFVYGGPERGRLIAGWVGTGRRVLDVGCRDGGLTRFYVAGNEIVGVDVDREALERAGRQLGIVTAWHDVTEGLPFDDASFDVVVAAEVLEHLPIPEVVVEEAARVLRPSGLFIGSVPNAYRFQNRLRVLLGKRLEDDPTHLRTFSPDSLRQLLIRQFEQPEIVFLMGRLRTLSGPWFAHDMVWRCARKIGAGK